MARSGRRCFTLPHGASRFVALPFSARTDASVISPVKRAAKGWQSGPDNATGHGYDLRNDRASGGY